MKNTLAVISIVFFAAQSTFGQPKETPKIINYNGSDVATTINVDTKFTGRYEGRKSGYLVLNPDGTGEYKYDFFGFAPSDCHAGPIKLEWGFIKESPDSIVKLDKEYGNSYPILLKATGPTKFQGCTKEVMLDFIMEYKNGNLSISSSDDWGKDQI